MKLNDLIRQYRKKCNLTQEQLANYLGVSAPAVNKWENGISYPDITLLPPLARVLKTDINTLLSFHEELTGPEIDSIILDITSAFTTEDYAQTFSKGESYIHEYAACDKLVLSITQILFGCLGLSNIADPAPYREKLLHWYELLIDSKDLEIRTSAAASLSQFYISMEQFDKAQTLLDSIPHVKLDKRLIQAQLHIKQSDYVKTYEVYEHMLLESAAKTYSILLSILEVLCIEGKYDKAHSYTELAASIASLMGMDSYDRIAPSLLCFAMQKDVPNTLETLRQLVQQFDSYDMKDSPLYSHITWKDNSLIQKRQIIKQAFASDHNFEFLNNNEEYQRLIKQL